jgi:hypothetical protein
MFCDPILPLQRNDSLCSRLVVRLEWERDNGILRVPVLNSDGKVVAGLLRQVRRQLARLDRRLDSIPLTLNSILRHTSRKFPVLAVGLGNNTD